mmetsp:Transcript_13716/g.44807  ORF Transcript_13716/g.44807 Transcript_13716/m.44807 type:complete len:109 (+) Transcript_13716:1098-1424(+)
MRGASSPSARTLFTSRSWVPASRSPLRPQPTAASLHRWTLLLSRALLPVGTTFVGRLLSTVPVGQGTSDEVVGVVPTIRGRAWVTQYATIVLDPTDPFPEGYTMGDIW